MAHFAKLGEGNIVLTVNVVDNNDAPTEQAGIDFLNNLFKTNDNWKQTSCNTRGGIHYTPNSNTPDGGLALRKNYAGIGYIYNEGRDAFMLPQPFPSWTLNEDTCWWEAPVAYPDDGQPGDYRWNEETTNWIEIT